MLLTKEDKLALKKTIERTGFTERLTDVSCVAFSSADFEGNKAVHAKANEYVLEVLLKDEPGECIHITGGMRALADPFHRRLCAELAKRSNIRFTVIYNVPENFQNSPEGVGTWTARTWGTKTWVDKISAMNLIGDALVDVRAFNVLDEIQYSVFGNRYILLQEQHSDEQTSTAPLVKRIWLLNSRKLNEYLTDRAKVIVRKSKDIPETYFKRFSAKISGITAQKILRSLRKEGGSAPVERIINVGLREFDANVDNELDILKAIGFIKDVDQERLTLTSEGIQYLDAIK